MFIIQMFIFMEFIICECVMKLQIPDSTIRVRRHISDIPNFSEDYTGVRE